MHYNSKSLFHTPLYKSINSRAPWCENFLESCGKEDSLEWDVAAIYSTLSCGFPLGDRTLFKQVKRRPWISEVQEKGCSTLLDIPTHSYIWKEPKQAARDLFDLLCEEIEAAAGGAETIYLLLSGGLDSRVVAGITRYLKEKNKVTDNIVAVTWGGEDSRDVQYAKELAIRYGYTWHHAPLTEESLEKNIELMAEVLGGANSPIHLHRMDWFQKNANSDSIVLAGSYGDSVGRGEFSKRTVLELLPIKPFNIFDLLDPRAAILAEQGVKEDISFLEARSGLDTPDYIKREHQQQGFYMRGLIAHTMSIINYSGVSHILSLIHI